MILDLRNGAAGIPDVKIVNRPWGHYKMFAENTQCTAKVLHIRKDEMLSLQYHRIRDQVYYCLDDFEVWHSDIPVPKEIDEDMNFIPVFVEKHLKKGNLKKGDIVYIPKYYIHRPVYRGSQEYGCIIDMAFGHNDENDIFRIEDKYGR
jgi:mannose-1-phosphate guanylyltransferase/mannose-6-phosphate isomerase